MPTIGFRSHSNSVAAAVVPAALRHDGARFRDRTPSFEFAALRRRGERADVKWDEGVLLVRRSQTVGGEVMETTKTKKRQKLFVPTELMDVLRWHVDHQIPGRVRSATDLLFPSETGGFRSGSVLDRPFRDVVLAIKLGKRVTPRGMRRTYQDLARKAEMKDLVTRAIAGVADAHFCRHLLRNSPRGEGGQLLVTVGRLPRAAGFQDGVQHASKDTNVVRQLGRLGAAAGEKGTIATPRRSGR